MQDMDKILQESNDLELIVSFYERNGQPEKAKPHIKRIFDQRVKQKDWKELVNELRKYRDYLTANEQRRYVNIFVIKYSEHSGSYTESKVTIIREFPELVDDSVFSSFFCNVLEDTRSSSYFLYHGISDIYELIEKHKGRINIEELKPKLIDALAYLIGHGKAKKADVERFELYLDDETKSSMVIRAMVMAHPHIFELRTKGRDKSKEPARILSEFRDYLSREHVYDFVKKSVESGLEKRTFWHDVTMSSERIMIELLRNDFLADEQVREFVSKIAAVQFKYAKPEVFQEDPAGDIHEAADPDYGLPSALETVKQFPGDVEPGLARKIKHKALAKQFYEEANERHFRKTKGTAKETIKACTVDRDTIERALADAFKEALEWITIGHAENVLKKFSKYVNREYIAEAIEAKLPEHPEEILKNYGHFLSDERLKAAVKSTVRERALEDNFRDLSDLVKSAESKFTPEELSDFFLGLFEDVRDNLEVSKFKERNRKRQDAVLEFLAEFSGYVPRNERTEVYYELLDLKRSLED